MEKFGLISATMEETDAAPRLLPSTRNSTIGWLRWTVGDHIDPAAARKRLEQKSTERKRRSALRSTFSVLPLSSSCVEPLAPSQIYPLTLLTVCSTIQR
jgi:hypothetical protein